MLILTVLLPAISEAQLSAPGMTAVRFSSYLSAPSVNDPLFIFCNSSGTQKGALNAVSPKGTGPFNYSWLKWSDISKSFSIPVKTETGVKTSSLNNLDEGGYKVIISGGFDTSLVGWIFFDKPPLARANLQQQLCERVALNGDTASLIKRFYYKDILNGSTISLKNEISFSWSSDPYTFIPKNESLDKVIENVPSSPNKKKIYNVPMENVTFKLRVNSLGCSSESSFFYESIHVKADFAVDPQNGEAPLEVAFTDKSVRGFKYKWEFGDGKDSISELSNPSPHTYYKPGEYSVLLTIESELHCIDSLRSDKIVVEPSKLDIPNVFTPDGDGVNDFFMVEKKSLRYISVEVFSRSGRRVYNFYGDGEKLREWEGWDGNINKSSIKASPGVYFYIIQAYGWDDVDYNSKEQRGFVHLYR
jgi:gliding motility-associated-like protein